MTKAAARDATLRRRLPAEVPGSLYGIGVDILHVERMERLLARHGRRLLAKLLCAAEVHEVRTRVNTARALAMCFAAKEAFVKALGTGFSGVGYKDAGVVREAGGRPRLVFSRSMQARLRRIGIGAAHISLSDDGGMVCAYVVLERADANAVVGRPSGRRRAAPVSPKADPPALRRGK